MEILIYWTVAIFVAGGFAGMGWVLFLALALGFAFHVHYVDVRTQLAIYRDRERRSVRRRPVTAPPVGTVGAHIPLDRSDLINTYTDADSSYDYVDDSDEGVLVEAA